jgi:hypothetical protein
MADNNYTCFDPLFWSLHAGIDRVFEGWLRRHPAAQYTASFPLRPFVGNRAQHVDLTNPNAFVYTTIGDMAKDSRALGYDYALTLSPGTRGTPYGPAAAVHHDNPDVDERLFVMFPDSRCVQRSYYLDVFLNLPNDDTTSISTTAIGPADAPDHFVGRVTRLGMGVEDDKGRCVRRGTTRLLDATHTARHLGLSTETAPTVTVVVTDLHSGELVTDTEALPGFRPVLRWTGTSRPADAALPSPPLPACH